jgi:hypothetical protein
MGDLKPEKGEDFRYGGWYKMLARLLAVPATEDEMQKDLRQAGF